MKGTDFLTDLFSIFSRICAKSQVFLHRQRSERPSPFGNARQATPRDLFSAQTSETVAAEQDIAPSSHALTDRAQRDSFAGAVCTQKRCDRARLKRQVEAEQNLAVQKEAFGTSFRRLCKF